MMSDCPIWNPGLSARLAADVVRMRDQFSVKKMPDVLIRDFR
jgi:hypothetical protein